jgi:hypothetical protein
MISAMAGTSAAVAARMRGSSVINLYRTALMNDRSELAMRWSCNE